MGGGITRRPCFYQIFFHIRIQVSNEIIAKHDNPNSFIMNFIFMWNKNPKIYLINTLYSHDLFCQKNQHYYPTSIYLMLESYCMLHWKWDHTTQNTCHQYHNWKLGELWTGACKGILRGNWCLHRCNIPCWRYHIEHQQREEELDPCYSVNIEGTCPK